MTALWCEKESIRPDHVG